MIALIKIAVELLADVAQLAIELRNYFYELEVRGFNSCWVC